MPKALLAVGLAYLLRHHAGFCISLFSLVWAARPSMMQGQVNKLSVAFLLVVSKADYFNAALSFQDKVPCTCCPAAGVSVMGSQAFAGEFT